MKKLILVVSLALTGLIPAWAGDPPVEPAQSAPEKPGADVPRKHAIDVQIDELLARDESTHGMIQAFGKGQELWDKELNRVYKELMKALANDPEGKKALVEAQRAWIAFRDQELKLLHAVYSRKDGSMFRPMAADDVMNVTRARAIELKDRLSIITEEGM